MNKIAKFLKTDFLIALMFRGSGVIFVFALNIILARLYGPELSGYYYIFYNFLALVDSIVFMGFAYVIVHKITPYFSNSDDNGSIQIGNTLLSMTIYILIVNAVLMTAIVALLSRPLSMYLCGTSEYSMTVIWTALSILPYTAMFFLAELFKALKKPNWSIVCTNIIANVLFILLILSVKKEYINWLMGMYCLANVVSVLVMIGSGRNTFKSANICVYSLRVIKDNYAVNTNIYREYFKENWVLTAVSVSNVILNVFDTIVIGNMLSATDVALYSVANKVVSVGSIILTTVNTVIGYKIADASHRKDNNALRKILVKYTRLMFPLGGLYYILVIAFASLIPFIFGSAYHGSIMLAILLAIGQVVTIITGPCSYFMIMTGQTKKYQRIVVYTAVLTVLLNLILVKSIGIYGSVVTSIVTLTFKNVYAFICSKQSISLKMRDFIRLKED